MSLSASHLALLKLKLERDLVPFLPALLDSATPLDKKYTKNLSRAFGAFALQQLCGITSEQAAEAVIDDTDDKGIDAIYYHAPTLTLYLVQSKLKDGEQFGQKEALEFTAGIRKIVAQDLDDFNAHVQRRRIEIEDAVEKCDSIVLVVAHVGSGISLHAQTELDNILKNENLDEERLTGPIIDYDPLRVVQDLRQDKAYQIIAERVIVHKCSTIGAPRHTYFGYVMLADLVQLHTKHGVELYEQNIRNSLGNKTDVNASIQQTLAQQPEEFFYLNNGVTALCQSAQPKGSQGGKTAKKIDVKGLSIINGAQTVAAAAHLLQTDASTDISSAKVTFTLIVVPPGDAFGKKVTQARNHQNPVNFTNFAALDDEQERLRRELAQLGIHYAYKRGVSVPQNGADSITIDEAAFALALFHRDPRYAVWLKREPRRFLNTQNDEYKALFSPTLTAHQLVNAVLFSRHTQTLMDAAIASSSSPEHLIYRHGASAFAWMLAKRVSGEQQGAKLFDNDKLASQLSRPADELRQLLLDEATARTINKGPLALFKNQTDVVSLLDVVASDHYGLTQHPALAPLRQQQQAGQAYPKGLFTFLIAKAPQIGNLV
jgi:hypothetical protein